MMIISSLYSDDGSVVSIFFFYFCVLTIITLVFLWSMMKKSLKTVNNHLYFITHMMFHNNRYFYFKLLKNLFIYHKSVLINALKKRLNLNLMCDYRLITLRIYFFSHTQKCVEIFSFYFKYLYFFIFHELYNNSSQLTHKIVFFFWFKINVNLFIFVLKFIYFLTASWNNKKYFYFFTC